MTKLKAWRSTIWRSGLNLLFPPACAACQAEIEGDDDINLCVTCRQALTVKHEPSCSRCGDWHITTQGNQPRCASCARHKVRFERVAILGKYDHLLRQSVLRMKHPGQEALALALGELSVCELGESVAEWSPDVIVPVPMHWRRRLSRGVNSPEILCEVWSRHLRLPFERRMLIRQRNTLPQADLSPDDRFRNMRNAFRVSANYRLQGAKILLVDDILTTGATCHEAAVTLCQSGAGSVCVFALARAGE